jgi:hypothetical protein
MCEKCQGLPVGIAHNVAARSPFFAPGGQGSGDSILGLYPYPYTR